MNYSANLQTENVFFFEQPYLKQEHFDLEGDSLFEENYNFSSFHKIFPEPSQKNQDNQQEKSLENESTLSNNEIKEVQRQKIEKQKKITKERQNQKQKGHHTLKKSKEQVIKKTPDYKKNICGYITKKIIKELLNETFRRPVTYVLQKFGATFESFAQILKNYNHITGPTHLYELVNTSFESQQTKDLAQQILIKRAFKELFIWFLRNRYIRFIMNEGKMERKDVYIRYKNRELLHLINQQSEYAEIKIDESIKIINQSNYSNRLLHGEQAKHFGQKVYTELVQSNEIQMKEKPKQEENKLKPDRTKKVELQSSLYNHQQSIFQLKYTFQNQQTFEFMKIEF